MRFRLRFTRGPAAEFSVADDLLQQSPDTRLSRLAAAAVEAGDSRVAVWKSTIESRGHGDNVASMAWGARNLISTPIPTFTY